MNAVSKNIKTMRLALGITQEALASRLFVTRQTVSNWENGKSQPDIDTLIKIADAMDTDVTALLYGLPDSEARRKEKRRFLITAGVLLILGSLLVFIAPKAEEMHWRHYSMYLFLLLQLFLFPALALLFGWTAMQGLGVLGVLKPVKSRYSKIVFAAVVTVIVLYVLLMPVYICGVVQFPYWFARFMLTAMGAITRQPFIFLIPGALLWLFRVPKQAVSSQAKDVSVPCDISEDGDLPNTDGNSPKATDIPKSR